MDPFIFNAGQPQDSRLLDDGRASDSERGSNVHHTLPDELRNNMNKSDHGESRPRK